MDEKDKAKQRKYIRHSADLPIEIQMGDLVTHKTEYLNNVSFGGLSFKSGTPVELGTVIKIKIPLTRPVFETTGKVKWCECDKDHYDVGVEFITPKDMFKIRMLEQICHIENYKKKIKDKDGRNVTGEQAALEWIRKYADKFPQDK